MKNLNLPRSIKVSYLSILIIGVFLSACNKSSLYPNEPQSSTNAIALSEDSIFKSLVIDLRDYNEVVSNAHADTIMNQHDFEINFNNAVQKNDLNARKLIANTMGFGNENEFWKIRDDMTSKIVALSKKYNLNKISPNNLNKIITNQISTSTIIGLNNKRFTSLRYDNAGCLDIFSNCKNQASSNYALEQVNCVGFGVFGWTLIGGALFIACEAASNYHLYVSDRSCNINLKYCK